MRRRLSLSLLVALGGLLVACGAPDGAAPGDGAAAPPVATGSSVAYATRVTPATIAPTTVPTMATRVPTPTPARTPPSPIVVPTAAPPTATPPPTPLRPLTATPFGAPTVAPEVVPTAPPASCPVTPPPNPPFVPPDPLTSYAGSFWYGTAALWKDVPRDGTWRALPYYDGAFSQKVFWWSQGYSWTGEPEPALAVTGRRLDAPAPPLGVSRPTNAFAEDIGSAMLVGVRVPTPGCWEIIGRYKGHELTFVVWVAP